MSDAIPFKQKTKVKFVFPGNIAFFAPSRHSHQYKHHASTSPSVFLASLWDESTSWMKSLNFFQTYCSSSSCLLSSLLLCLNYTSFNIVINFITVCDLFFYIRWTISSFYTLSSFLLFFFHTCFHCFSWFFIFLDFSVLPLIQT